MFRMRERGFSARLRDAGVVRRSEWWRRAPATVAGGRAAMRALLRLPDRPTGVFFANDLMAIGAIKQCLHDGLRLPDDVSIVGCDDIEFSRYVTPRAHDSDRARSGTRCARGAIAAPVDRRHRYTGASWTCVAGTSGRARLVGHCTTRWQCGRTLRTNRPPCANRICCHERPFVARGVDHWYWARGAVACRNERRTFRAAWRGYRPVCVGHAWHRDAAVVHRTRINGRSRGGRGATGRSLLPD